MSRHVSDHYPHTATEFHTNSQNRRGPACDLCASRIVDYLRAESEAHRLGLQHEHILLTVDLDGDLGLSHSLPTPQHGMCRVRANESFVAPQRRVPALRSDLACESTSELYRMSHEGVEKLWELDTRIERVGLYRWSRGGHAGLQACRFSL